VVLPVPASSLFPQPSTVCVVALHNRLALAREQLDGRSLLDRAVAAGAASCSRVLVVARPGDQIDAGLFDAEGLRPETDAGLVEAIGTAGRVLIHDLACPTTPVEFLHAMSAAEAPAAVAVTELTDTVKVMRADRIAHTLGRERLAVVASPVAVDRAVLQRAVGVVDALGDLAAVVERLREVGPVELTPAPPQARRVSGPDDLRLLALRRLA
jgi:hypothetical protein